MSADPSLFSIGEFSRITGLSVKTLRFYDEKQLLKPAFVDPSTSYRFYDGPAVERARVIAQLRELQFPLEEIAQILGACEDEHDLLAHLERQHRAIESRIRADRKIAAALAGMIKREQEAAALAAEPATAIEDKMLEPLLVAGYRMTGRYADIGRGFALLGRRLGRQIAGRPLCLYHDDEYKEEAVFEPCVPLRQPATASAEVQVQTLPATRCLALLHRGPYDQLGHSYRRLITEAKRRGLALTRPSREVFIKGPGMIFRGSPRRYLTEIQLPFVLP